MLNCLQNVARIMSVVAVVPKIHALEGDDERSRYFEQMWNECLLLGKNSSVRAAPYTLRTMHATWYVNTIG